MSFYVEVMCNVGRVDNSRCWSFNNDNPQGTDLKNAAAEARKQGWVIKGRYACCPACKS